LPAAGSAGTLRIVDDEAVTIVMTLLADIRTDVRKIREEVVDDDGEEEEEDR
jgi:hypothetical protein